MNKIKELTDVKGVKFREEEVQFLSRYSYLLSIKYQATGYLILGKKYDITLESVLNFLTLEDAKKDDETFLRNICKFISKLNAFRNTIQIN